MVAGTTIRATLSALTAHMHTKSWSQETFHCFPVSIVDCSLHIWSLGVIRTSIIAGQIILGTFFLVEGAAKKLPVLISSPRNPVV